MVEPNKIPGKITDEQQAVLLTLRALLRTIGSANDAEDHGFLEAAEQMRKEACETIRSQMQDHGFLAELFPKLEWELETRHILGYGWVEIKDSLDLYLKGSGNGG
jgi:hypothetical protein